MSPDELHAARYPYRILDSGMNSVSVLLAIAFLSLLFEFDT